MDQSSETNRLGNAVSALAFLITEIITEKLHAVATVQEERIAGRAIEPVLTKRQRTELLQVSVRTVDLWMRRGLINSASL